jgi:hypothetical protein
MSPKRLANVLGVPEYLVEDLRRAGLPVARNVSTGEWWLSGEDQLASWRLYANPKQPEPGWHSSTADFQPFTAVDKIGSASRSSSASRSKGGCGLGLSRLGPTTNTTGVITNDE